MTPAQLQVVEEVFHAALEREPGKVKEFLDTACGGDAFVRRQVEALLVSDHESSDFIEGPPDALVARMIETEASGAPSMLGRTIGHYRILELLSRGGMGEVYIAVDTKAERKAVLKVLPERFTADPGRARRFQQEARAVIALNHPNILTIYEIGEEESTYYIVSELIEGEALRQRLARERLGLKEAVDITIQVASALSAAHQAGIVHRDVKPENIMLRRDGYVKVLDFGIAKLAESAFAEPPLQRFGVPGATADTAEPATLARTNLGSILGTVRYMSPEQARGEQVDHRTDIWSLGVVLCEMITGSNPFVGHTPQEVINTIVTSKPSVIASHGTRIPRELAQIVTRALRINREERYATANEMLDDLKGFRRELEFTAELKRVPFWRRWPSTRAALLFGLLVAAIAVALPFFWSRSSSKATEKKSSIAVLPFENVGNNNANALLVDGVQTEISSDLAKIAELKVISQRSVNSYHRPRGRNLRQIGVELGATHLVEGSVQRAGDRVYITVQLIDARNGAHLWGQSYDRAPRDVLAMENEIAAAITSQLKTEMSQSEKAALAKVATTNVAANDLLLRAQQLRSSPSDPGAKQNLLEAAGLLEEAIARDPQFLLAHCFLADTHLILYWNGFDHSPARRELAKAALDSAARLQPDAAEVHLTRGVYYYHGFRDYERARTEFELASKSMPNEPDLYLLLAAISRRQARWDNALQNFRQAVELDPRNSQILTEVGVTCAGLRRYNEARNYLGRALAIAPNDYYTRTLLPQLDLYERGTTKPLRDTLTAILKERKDAGPHVAYALVNCALAERDQAAATEALSYIPPEGLVDPDNEVLLPKEWYVGLVARSFGEISQAQTAFVTARSVLQHMTVENPENAPVWGALGLADAALGRAEEASQEGRKACELLPLQKDAWNGPGRIVDLAVIYTWLGDTDSALQQLQISATQPGGVFYGTLKLFPHWDPLRGDARFEKIVASLGPK